MKMLHSMNSKNKIQKKAKVLAVITDNINENKFDTHSELS